jgi:hypothetical protein
MTCASRFYTPINAADLSGASLVAVVPRDNYREQDEGLGNIVSSAHMTCWRCGISWGLVVASAAYSGQQPSLEAGSTASQAPAAVATAPPAVGVYITNEATGKILETFETSEEPEGGRGPWGAILVDRR